MKSLPRTLLALAFASFSLLALLSITPEWESPFAHPAVQGSRVSELGLRFSMQR